MCISISIYICIYIYTCVHVCVWTRAHVKTSGRTRARAHTAACPGHVDDVGASRCGRTIIQRARGWMAEATGVGEERGRWILDAGWWMLSVGWRCTRWSISRGRSLNPQLHPRTLGVQTHSKNRRI